jgi:HipA-like protein
MEAPNPIQAIQHVRKMRGGAQAHLLRASDNHFYVTKFQNNPQAVRILANEYLSTRLGRSLGLPMPEVAIIEVSEWLIQNSPDLKIDLGTKSVSCASGLQLGSRYVADPLETAVFDYLPEGILNRIANWQHFSRVLAFDKWTCNSDGRQAVFVKQPKERRYRAIFIDQGYCFNAGEWSFLDSALRGAFARNSVYERVTGWSAFDPTLSLIEQIDQTEIWNVAQEIPPQWYEHDSEALSRLIESLHQRRSLVRDLITSFRHSTRKPFPNWTAE